MPTEPTLRRRSFLLPAAILLAAAVLVLSDLLDWFDPPTPLRDGQAAMTNGHYVAAIRDFSQAQRLCETDIAARYLLGAAYQNYGWHDEAIEQYETAWLLAAENGARAMHSAGRIWYRRGDPGRAAACFRNALALKPQSADIWFELGILLRQDGRQDAALAAFQEAARLEPENAQYRQQAGKSR